MFRKLKRIKQALTDDRCKEILSTTLRGTLALIGDNGYPYAITLNHYYNEDGCLYFHSGRAGHKIDALTANDKACYTVYTQLPPNPDSWALDFESVVVFGKIEIVNDTKLTETITRALSYKFTNDSNYIEDEIAKFLNATTLLKLTPLHVTGKKVNEA